MRPPAGHRATVDEIRRRGERLRSARVGVQPTWRIGPDSPQRSRAEAQVGFFYEQMAGLYSPIFEAIAAMRSGGSADDLEMLVRFLEAGIYCDRSGYVTADVIAALRRSNLPTPLAARLRHVVLVAVDGRDRREFRAFCRLASSVSDAWLDAELRQRLPSPDARIARHAEWVLAAIAATSR